MARYVVAGIGTEIGKTVFSAVLVEALNADYWKPVQAGSLDATDSDTIRALAPGANRVIHDESYRLTRAMSPHAAALAENITIELDCLKLPKTDRNLVVEMAGGLMVPLAPGFLNIDLIAEWAIPVVLVSQYYLGSINHTLLSLAALRKRGIPIAGLIFNGEPVDTTRSVIVDETKVPVILDAAFAQDLNCKMIATWARAVQL